MSRIPLSLHAKRYRVSVRTVLRWKKAGVDLCDPGAVSDYVMPRHGQSLATLKAIAAACISQPNSK